MRIAYLPVISARNVQSAPSYNFFVALHRHALQLDPTSVFYVLVPEVVDGNRWQGGADWSLPRTHVLPVTMNESQSVELGLITRDVFELFNERFGECYFDLILSEKPMLASLLRQVTEFHVNTKSRGTLVVNRDQFTQDRGSQHCSVEVELLQAAGWLAGPTIFQSDHQLKRAMGVARRHLAPAHVRSIGEQSVVFPLGIDCADVDSTNMAERGQKNPDVTVNYSAKLFHQNKFVESLKIMDSTYAGGRQVELQVVTGSAAAKLAMIPRSRPFAYITTFGGTGRRQFLKQMARAHIFISNSPWEDFSATICEQLWTGLVPVLPDEPWARYLLPAQYPLLFRSMDEGQAMLRYAVDNLADLQAEWVPRIQQKVAAEFDLAAIVPQMLTWMAELNAKRRTDTAAATGQLRELVEKAFEAVPAEFGEEELYAAIKENSEGLDVNRDVESRSTSRWLCVDIMLATHPELVDLGGRRVRWQKP